MGLYQRHILPRVIHCGMRNAKLSPLRSSLLAPVRGRVVEIGIGSGLNIPFYSRDVIQVIGVDPSKALLDKAKATAVWSRCSVRLVQGFGEALPLQENSVDYVIMTWTLCSVADPLGTLSEARRVLRPDGVFLFIEHGLATDNEPRLQRLQHMLTPLWRRFAGNCHLNRRVDQLLKAAGFSLETLEHGCLIDAPKPLAFGYRGRAVITGAS
jgi:ubiquinone/menaquinone biosynthesis C-methylase UbiE